MFGYKGNELIEGVEIGGVAMYVDELSSSNAGLFIRHIPVLLWFVVLLHVSWSSFYY
jgi:hypothetical protein